MSKIKKVITLNDPFSDIWKNNLIKKTMSWLVESFGPY